MPGIALYQCERHVLIHDLEAKFSLALDEGEGEAELLKYLFVKGNSIHDYANRLASSTGATNGDQRRRLGLPLKHCRAGPSDGEAMPEAQALGTTGGEPEKAPEPEPPEKAPQKKKDKRKNRACCALGA